MYCSCMGGDLAPSLGARKKISRTKFSNQWPFFHLTAQNFVSHLSISAVPYITYIHIWPFSWPKRSISEHKIPHWHVHLLFTQFLVSLTSNNSTSQSMGGRMHGSFPTSNFGEGRCLQSSLSHRPWLQVIRLIWLAHRIVFRRQIRRSAGAFFDRKVS